MADEIEEGVSTFYATFGYQYSHEEHPTLKHAHPDGYVKIMATSYEEARNLIDGLTRGAYSMIYTKEEWLKVGEDKLKGFYPRGCIQIVISCAYPEGDSWPPEQEVQEA